MAGANQAQTKRKPSANQIANQIPHDVPSFAGRYLRRRKPSRKPNRLSAAIEPGHVCRFSMGYGPGWGGTTPGVSFRLTNFGISPDPSRDSDIAKSDLA